MKTDLRSARKGRIQPTVVVFHPIISAELNHIWFGSKTQVAKKKRTELNKVYIYLYQVQVNLIIH